MRLQSSVIYFLFFILICMPLKTHAMSLLSQAEALIFAAPEKSLEITKTYLIKKHMSKKNISTTEKSTFKFSRQVAYSTVNAYLINAQAYTSLGNEKAAWKYLDKAKALALTYKLRGSHLKLLFTEAILITYLNKDPVKASVLIKEIFAQIPSNTLDRSQHMKKIAFESRLLYSIVISQIEDETTVINEFEITRKEIEKSDNLNYKIYYLIAYGNYFLQIQSYERALAQLLSAYWLASENDIPLQIAYANLSLTKLYKHQEVLDKALQHANQAAEYYERYDLLRGLSYTQFLLGNIYGIQGRYNFALVHYFNALEIINTYSSAIEKAKINNAIAKIYLKMKRYKMAEKYSNTTIEITELNNILDIKTDTYLLKGELALLRGHTNRAISLLTQARQWAQENNHPQYLIKSFSLLSLAHEKKGDFKKAVHFERQTHQLVIEETKRDKIQKVKTFKFQHQDIEKQLQNQYIIKKQGDDSKIIIEQKKINLFLIGSLCISIFVLLLRHRTANARNKELINLQKELNTHPRSGLRNLRILNDSLSTSQAKIHAHFEQSSLEEMIHMPLKDKLNFAMFEVPFLKVLYLQHSYREGLKLERQLGRYLKLHIKKPARLYHFSDAIFVYTQPSEIIENSPEELANMIHSLLLDFIKNIGLDHVHHGLCIGMANYPFLPRAFASINNKKLIDILLMATNAAREASKSENSNQWVHLSAIDSTPAACFANLPVRQACIDSINSGLIKVKTSAANGIIW